MHIGGQVWPGLPVIFCSFSRFFLTSFFLPSSSTAPMKFFTSGIELKNQMEFLKRNQIEWNVYFLYSSHVFLWNHRPALISFVGKSLERVIHPGDELSTLHEMVCCPCSWGLLLILMTLIYFSFWTFQLMFILIATNSVVPARLWVNQNDGDLNNVFTFEAADHDLQPIS